MKRLLTKILLLSFIAIVSFSTTFSSVQSEKNSEQTEDKGTGEKGEIHKAVIISKPSPDFPSAARGVKAVVTIQLVLSSSGKVTNAKSVEVAPDNLPSEVEQALIKNSIKAANRIKFKPATKSGKPVSQYVIVKYYFQS